MTQDRAPATQAGRPSAAPLASAVRGTSLGRYVLIDRLGEGGFGVVYKAFDTILNRAVALKLSHPDVAATEAARARLLREARALARLSHPNVVAVHDVGVVDGMVFIATEYIEGQTLRDWLRAGPRSQEEVLVMFTAAGRGLAAAHAAGLVHRDFKPANVMVPATGAVRVLDFGIAREAEGEGPDSVDEAGVAAPPAGGPLETLTRAGAVIGTPAYMAPEQFRAERSDARADVYAFSVALYEALVAALPYDFTEAGLDVAVLTGRVKRPPPEAGVPGWLVDILMKGMSLDPAARYARMQDMLAALVYRGGEGQLGVDPALVEPHISNRMLWPALEMIGEEVGMDVLADAVAEAGLTLDHLRDASGWTSVSFNMRAFDALSQRLYPGEKVRYDHPLYRRWYQARRARADTPRRGLLATALTALGSPRLYYMSLPNVVHLASRVTDVTVEEPARGVAVIHARPSHPSIPDHPGYCWSRRGAFESGPRLWGLPFAEVTHTVCMHDPVHPADECVYRVSYQERGGRRLSFGLTLAGGAVAALAVWLAGAPLAVVAAAGLLGALAAEGWRRARVLQHYRDDARRLLDGMLESDRRYAALWKDRQALHGALAARDAGATTQRPSS